MNELVGPYRGQSVSLNTFAELVRKIDPCVTSHEINTVFAYVDADKSGWIEWQGVEDKIFNVDFRETGDVRSRQIDEIVAIFKDRKEDPEVVFHKIDTNHSGFLDYS